MWGGGRRAGRGAAGTSQHEGFSRALLPARLPCCCSALCCSKAGLALPAANFQWGERFLMPCQLPLGFLLPTLPEHPLCLRACIPSWPPATCLPAEDAC